MFLLSHFNSNKKLTWYSVASFLEDRTSTQVRTHIQKFRKRTNSYLSEVIEMQSQLDSSEKAQSNLPCQLETRHIRTIEELCKDYLAIYHMADKSGNRDANPKLTFKDALINNRSIPEFIADIEDKTNGRKILDSRLEAILKNSYQTTNLVNQLIESLSQE